MIDSLAARWLRRYATCLTIALVALHSLGCLRSVDVSRLKCTTDETCPENYTCQKADMNDVYGRCVVPSDAGSGTDAQAGDVALDSRDSGRSSDVGVPDGLTVKDGPSGTVDAPISGGEDAEDAIDAPVQGSAEVLSSADTGSEAGKQANGSQCALDSECKSSHCVDGVCCDAWCDGQCESCKESGSLGKCVAAKGDPVAPRLACPGTGNCKGQCDGLNGKVCTFPDNPPVCTPPKCANGMATPASVCVQGECTKPTSGSCPSGQCANDGSGKCAGSCPTTPCGEGLFCNTAGACVAKKTPGASCEDKDKNECLSGFCVDGVCCESACADQCKACDGKGACVRVTGPPRTGHKPCTATDAICGGTCDGTSDSCVYKDENTECTAATCSDASTAVTASTCNGKGACSPAQSTNCAASGGYCSVNKCATKKNNGNACEDNVECTNGNCSNGTCCGVGQTGCNGTCVDLKTSSTNCGSCGRSCGGQSCCASTCVDLTVSNSHCGTCGVSCGAQTCMTGICCASGSTNCGGACCDSNHTCSGSTCTCKGYAPSCGGCEAWSFESNTTEGWIRTPTSVRAGTEKNGITSMNIATGSYAHTGGHALAMRVQANSSTANGAFFVVPLCPSGAAVNLPAGITLTAWMRFVSDTGLALSTYDIFTAELDGASGSIGGRDSTLGSIPEGQWFKFTYQFTNTSSAATHVGFYWLSSLSWSGMVYLDDVQLKM